MTERDARANCAEIQDFAERMIQSFVRHDDTGEQHLMKMLDLKRMLDEHQSLLCAQHDPIPAVEDMMLADARDKAAGRTPGYGGAE